MAQGGGGSWKVAYADFVTAMMAFFMVMWITAQDQKVKTAVARYFDNPMGLSSIGASKKPMQAGSPVDVPSGNDVPRNEAPLEGTGEQPFSNSDLPTLTTKTVSDFIFRDAKNLDYWKREAKRHRDASAFSPESEDVNAVIDDIAISRLSRQLRETTIKNIPPQIKGVHAELLRKALYDVNWKQLAEDLMVR